MEKLFVSCYTSISIPIFTPLYYIEVKGKTGHDSLIFFFDATINGADDTLSLSKDTYSTGISHNYRQILTTSLSFSRLTHVNTSVL